MQAPDFTRAAVTDMNPGVMSAVTELEVEGETPYLWYAAKPGTYYFCGDADGDGATQYDVTVKEAGFYRFRNPGMRFKLIAAYDAVILNSTTGIEEAKIPGLEKALPALPVSDEWLRPFAGLDEVAWSITDSDKNLSFLQKVDIAIAMKKRLPNLTTVFLDDYFQQHMRPLAELEEARAKVHAAGLRVAAVMYADIEGLRESDLPSAKLCDVIALWFWKPASVDTMEAKVREAKRFLSGQRMMLGLYMFLADLLPPTIPPPFGRVIAPIPGAILVCQLTESKKIKFFILAG